MANSVIAITPDLGKSCQMLRPNSSLTIGILRRGYSQTGGVEAYLKGLAEGLQSGGHRVVLLGTGEWPAEQWQGGEIIRCSGKTLGSYASDVAFHRRAGLIPFDLILSVEKVPGCDLYRTDEGIHASWLAERSRHMGSWARIFQHLNPKHREKLRLDREIFSPGITRRVISLSEKISGEIVSRYGYPATRISMIRNGVALRTLPTREEREEARRELGIAPEARIALFVGTGWERKGLRFAIRAIEKLNDPKLNLLVVGRGPQKRYAAPAVRFYGAVMDMAKVYAAADLFLFPTLFDPFPLASLEALRAGLPVITTAANGVSEVMTHGEHGEIIAEASDTPTFAAAVFKWLAILGDPERSVKTRSQCAALAAEFTLERNLRETLSVIHGVVDEKSREERGSRGLQRQA